MMDLPLMDKQDFQLEIWVGMRAAGSCGRAPHAHDEVPSDPVRASPPTAEAGGASAVAPAL